MGAGIGAACATYAAATTTFALPPGSLVPTQVTPRASRMDAHLLGRVALLGLDGRQAPAVAPCKSDASHQATSKEFSCLSSRPRCRRLMVALRGRSRSGSSAHI